MEWLNRRTRMNDFGKLRVGLFGIGLDAYWPQFSGLRERLEGYLTQTAGRLERPGVEVVNLGLIDTPPKAMRAGHDFRRADVDLIVLHVTTYALSSTVLPAVRRAKVPVVLLNLQPGGAINYAAFNALGRPDENDRRVAGLVRRLSGAGDRQPSSAAAASRSIKSRARSTTNGCGTRSASGSTPRGSPTRWSTTAWA